MNKIIHFVAKFFLIITGFVTLISIPSVIDQSPDSVSGAEFFSILIMFIFALMFYKYQTQMTNIVKSLEINNSKRANTVALVLIIVAVMVVFISMSGIIAY